MEEVYRYRCVFDMKFSSIPYVDWKYIDYNEFCEIKEAIERGNKYELQILVVVHCEQPKNVRGD